METWWPDDPFVGAVWCVIGGGLGTVLGVGGPIVGGYLVLRGRCRRGVLIALIAVGTVGLLCAAAGVAAIVDGQPYGVYYPLLVVGCGLYWVAIPLVPAIDMAYRAVLANRPGGVNLLHPMWWSSALIREDWRPQGRYGRWVNPLITVHTLVGSVILIWGVWRFLAGAGFEEGFPGVFVGGGFLFLAGELWLIKALTLWWSSRTNEQQRLAAEELRRS